MCGFAAFFDSRQLYSKSLLTSVADDLYHRGPDSAGFFSKPGGSLVFRRLSIMDPLPHSDQPMLDNTERFAIVFNGEIYNFKKLRGLLQKSGVAFRTNSDTEVLLEGFKYWGESVLNYIEGMFAFVIWDLNQNLVFAARDTLGIKPLYLARRGAFTGFSSETGPLRRMIGTKVSSIAMAEILTLRYPTERRSSFESIELIPGGTMVRLDVKTNKLSEQVFEDLLETLIPDNKMSFNEAAEITEEAVVESVKSHLQSDVGYSLQLSGGVDSSLITAIAALHSTKPLKTFGIKLADSRHDESQYQRQVAELYNVDHDEVVLDSADFVLGLEETCRALEMPTAHFGCVFLKRLSEIISRQHKVSLVGEGADEFFGGYSRYANLQGIFNRAAIARIIPQAILDHVPRLSTLQRFKIMDPTLATQTYHNQSVAFSLFPNLEPYTTISHKLKRIKGFKSRMLAADQLGYLGSLLWRQDRIAMAHSLEVRTPFAHMPLARAVNKIPHRFRIPGNETKPLLKKMAEKYLPHDLIYRRKVGLTLPIDDWICDEKVLKPHVMAILEPNSPLTHFADRHSLHKFINAFYAGRITSPADRKIIPLLAITNTWLTTLDSR